MPIGGKFVNARAVTILKDKGKQDTLLFLEILCLRAGQITHTTFTKPFEQSYSMSRKSMSGEKSRPIQRKEFILVKQSR